MNIASVIVQGGLAHRAAQDYDEEQAGRAYTNRARANSVAKMAEEEARMPTARELDALKADILKNELAYQKSTQGRDQGMRDTSASIAQSTLQHQATTLPVRQGLDTGALDLATQQQKGAIALQPGANTIAKATQDSELSTLADRQTANIWSMVRRGEKEAALDFLNTSNILFKNRKFSDIDQADMPVIGADGKPLIQDGKPVVERVVRFVAADGGRNEFRPAKALDDIVRKHNTRVEKAGNNLVQIGPDGKATPLYEPDQTAVNPETGEYYSKNRPPPVGAAQAAQGMPGAPGSPVVAPPLGGKAQARADVRTSHLDDRVKMAIDKVILPTFGGRFEGGMFFPDEKNKDVALRATQIAGELIRSGVNPEAAGVQAVDKAKREKALADAAAKGGGAAAQGGYTGPTPWR